MTVRGWWRLTIPQILGAVAGLVVSLAGGVDARASMAPPRGLPAPQAAAWSERLADALQPARSGASAVYDVANNRVIVFGGSSGAFLNDTWALTFSGAGATGTGTWTKLQTIGDVPTPRMWHSAVYDSIGARMMVHGGYDGRVLDDTYTLDLATLTWRKYKASTRGLLAPHRYLASSLTRSDRVTNGFERSMLLFGGSDGDSLQNEFYQLILSSPDKRREGSWVQYTTVATPRPTKRYGAAIDATADSIYVFGGRDNTLYTNDAWMLNVSTGTWRQEVAPTNFRPNARFGSTISFDEASHTLRIYGGADARKVYGDVWVLGGLGTPAASWTAIDTLTADKDGVTLPELRGFPASVVLPSRDVLVAAGMGSAGMLGDAWRLPASSNTWQPVSRVTNPPSRFGHSLTYDPIRDRVFLYGGVSSFNETLGDVWTYAPGTQTWEKLALQDSLPSPRARAAAVFAQDSVWVFGGWRGFIARRGATLMVDFSYGDSLSVFSLATGKWRRVAPDGARPDGRDGATMVYDGARNRLLLFGGYNASGYLADLWSFDIASESWTRLPDFGGAGRTGHSAVIDQTGSNMVVFGGASLTGLLNDVRVFDLANNVWQTAPAVSGTPPSVREWASAFVDGATNSLIISGGASNMLEGSTILVPTPAPGTYALNLSTYTWSTLTVNGTGPGSRVQSPMVVAGSTAVLFGGSDGGSSRSDTWAFNLSAPAPASATTTLTGDGAVMVRWETSQNSPLGYAVVREPVLGASEQTVVAKVMASDLAPGSEWAEAADHSAAGGAYRYTVVNMATGSRIPAGEVVVPEAGVTGGPVVLGLRAQSPASAEAKLWLVGAQLGEQSAVPLQIFDVAGRHVADVSLRSEGGTTWTATWNGRDASGRLVRSGIYLARATVGTAVRQARIAIVR